MESKVFALDQTTIKKLLTIFKLVIPDFQRNFVWKKSKKEQLLDSLFRGFPIGAITLYEDKNAYYIIDGLQRINTLNQYLSRPGAIIPFDRFYKKVESDIQEFLKNEQLNTEPAALSKCIKKWYEKLNNLYEFEKVSVLYSTLKNGDKKIAAEFESLELVERLLDILKAKIEIAHDDIALIIYRGSKEDLPELFKNINTGSVALSQYEILQSVWNDYVLNRSLIDDAGEAFDRELDLIRGEYEIDAVKEAGVFDIFKNIVGVNHMICCKENCDVIFRFSGFKKISEPKRFDNGTVKYYDNDSIAFEIYSTILSNAPNKIINAMDSVFKHDDCDRISRFVNMLNKAVIRSVDIAIKELKQRDVGILESKYHSLFILAGIIFSMYDIDVEHLTVEETEINSEIYDFCLDVEQHRKGRWFVDENRQIGFFNKKIAGLLEKKKEVISSHEVRTKGSADNDKLKIKIGYEVIGGRTVKEFYEKIFAHLNEQLDLSDNIPFATGNKRYLVNWTDHHINGVPFVSPVKIQNYYVETNKNKKDALSDIYKYIKNIGVDVDYVD
ncbi:MAG: DUF262 domain-containing protein [Lachnospiraceae bacterium]|nr:DUF262 domain-containing protein [Lachnospiraceae bacterium]